MSEKTLKDFGFKYGQTVWIPAKINDVAVNQSFGDSWIHVAVDVGYGLTWVELTPRQIRRYLKREANKK